MVTKDMLVSLTLAGLIVTSLPPSKMMKWKLKTITSKSWKLFHSVQMSRVEADQRTWMTALSKAIRWIESSPLCPLRRQEITTKTVHSISKTSSSRLQESWTVGMQTARRIWPTICQTEKSFSCLIASFRMKNLTQSLKRRICKLNKSFHRNRKTTIWRASTPGASAEAYWY